MIKMFKKGSLYGKLLDKLECMLDTIKLKPDLEGNQHLINDVEITIKTKRCVK